MPNTASIAEARPLTVLIVGATRLYCDGIARLLSADVRCAVLGVSYEALDALDRAAKACPDVILIDAGMPNSAEVMRAVARVGIDARVVALAVDESRETIVGCAEAGVAGFVNRDASVEELIETLYCAHRGELRCSTKVAGTLLKHVATLAAGSRAMRQPAARELTHREREVAQLVALHLSNKQIASHLGIEFATVKNHVHHILEKLELRRRYDIPPVVRHSAHVA